MRVPNIYHNYHIPSKLQQHMLTVAAVGKYVLDHWQGEEIDKDSIVAALLVHDLGNLVKFDLNGNAKVIEPALFTEEWRDTQQQMIDKYGSDSHQATLKMLTEINLPEKIKQLAAKMDAGDICQIVNESIEQQICEYADLRVTPSAVVSMKTRMKDLRDRYANKIGWDDPKVFAHNLACAQQIKNNLQNQTSVDITAIAEDKIQAYLVELARFELPTS